MIHANSIQALSIAQPEFKNRKEQILDVLKKHPGKTSIWIADYLKTDLHKISGRFTQLKSEGKIVSIGDVKIGKTNFQQFVIKTESKQLSIF